MCVWLPPFSSTTTYSVTTKRSYRRTHTHNRHATLHTNVSKHCWRVILEKRSNLGLNYWEIVTKHKSINREGGGKKCSKNAILYFLDIACSAISKNRKWTYRQCAIVIVNRSLQVWIIQSFWHNDTFSTFLPTTCTYLHTPNLGVPH